MCSCANECVHVGPISTFDLNNSNSGVAQISNRARLVISRSIRSQTPRDRWHWPHVPSRTLLFNVFFVLSWLVGTRWTESWQLWSFQLVAQCVKPITFSQVSVLPKPTLLSCHLGRPESRSKACLSCSSHFDPFYGQKVPKMAINAVFWP